MGNEDVPAFVKRLKKYPRSASPFTFLSTAEPKWAHPALKALVTYGLDSHICQCILWGEGLPSCQYRPGSPVIANSLQNEFNYWGIDSERFVRIIGQIRLFI